METLSQSFTVLKRVRQISPEVKLWGFDPAPEKVVLILVSFFIWHRLSSYRPQDLWGRRSLTSVLRDWDSIEELFNSCIEILIFL